MSRLRYTFKTLPPEYANFKTWRNVDISELPAIDQKRFSRLQQGIEIYIRTGKLKVASMESGYSEDMLIKQLNRCVTIGSDGLLWGWAGLLKWCRIKNYERTSPIPTGSAGAVKGFSGCFSKFLNQHEDIRNELNALILKQRRKGHIPEARISIKKIAVEFKKLCLKHGVREDEYPLNVISCAKRSIIRYKDQLIQQDSANGTRARFGAAAANYLLVATGESSIPLALAPYDVGGLDAHEIHCIGCIVVPGPAGPQRIAIERLWVIFLVDEISTAILGYSVGIRTEVSSATVEEALISAISQWQPRKLTIPGLSYPEGGGLPSGVIPELVGCFPAVLKVDNAAAHFAKRIAEHARRRLGCAITWGPIGHWEHNAVVERLFKTLETYGFQRLPSTTGSNTEDTIKDKPIEQATKIGITWEALLDLTDVLVASHNIRGGRGLGGQSPLEVIINQLKVDEPLFLPRILPPATVDQPELGVVVETRFIRGNQRKGRRPYIQIDRVNYTSPVLANSFGLVGTQICVHIREADMRIVNSFLESGQELGSLRAQGRWGRTSHTREMRKQIMALVDAKEMALEPSDDPVQKLLEYYASKAYRDALKRPKSVSKSATKLANAVNVSGLAVPMATDTPPGNQLIDAGNKPVRPTPSTIKSPVWKSVT